MNEEENLNNPNLPEQHSGSESEAPDIERNSANEEGPEQNPANDVLQTKEQNTIVEQTTTQQPQTSNLSTEASAKADTKPETTDMEVHHHTHPGHHKKKWTDYFWEFLMLFLAVFCGFLAEYQLEHVIEHQREEVFIKSMIEDAQTDTANIRKALAVNRKRQLCADSLATACFDYNDASGQDQNIYRLYRRLLTNTDAVNPTERTLSQLKNAGGMRLIRNKKAGDAIVLYDYTGKQLLNQQAVIEGFLNETMSSSFELMNFKNFNPGTYLGVADSATLLTHDKAKLIVFANRIATAGAGLMVFNERLRELNEQALKMIATLRKEYNLENE